MNQVDKDYLSMCQYILDHGTFKEDRTGTGTYSVFGQQLRFNLSEGFPILTTKRVPFRLIASELLWFLRGDTKLRYLLQNNNHIWDEWEIDENGDWHATQMIPNSDGVLEKKEITKHFGKEYAHTIGTAYGWIVNKYKLIDNLIDKIKNNPTDRRMIMSLWQNEFLDTAVLPSCVWCTEWDVTDGKLNLWVHQRSCDVPLGLPFNVTQYAVLANLIAHVTGLKVGKMFWSIKDAHIYVNQVDGIKEQIRRGKELPDIKAPKLWINPEIKDFYEFDNSRKLNDIKIVGYEHHGKIEFPIAQ